MRLQAYANSVKFIGLFRVYAATQDDARNCVNGRARTPAILTNWHKRTMPITVTGKTVCITIASETRQMLTVRVINPDDQHRLCE